jgi:small GTP-binding protein
MSNKKFNIVVMGSGGVGKSCLTIRFVMGDYKERYDPTIEDSYRKLVALSDGTPVMLELLDTAGTEQFLSMRDLYMKNGDGFILCFALNDLYSFQQMKIILSDIIENQTQNNTNIKSEYNCIKPIVIVGTKCDIHTENRRKVPYNNINKYCQKRGLPYFEVSAKENVNVDKPFVDCATTLYNNTNKKKNRNHVKCKCL